MRAAVESWGKAVVSIFEVSKGFRNSNSAWDAIKALSVDYSVYKEACWRVLDKAYIRFKSLGQGRTRKAEFVVQDWMNARKEHKELLLCIGPKILRNHQKISVLIKKYGFNITILLPDPTLSKQDPGYNDSNTLVTGGHNSHFHAGPAGNLQTCF